ncbi:hypothetical protein EVAR_13927_1 [Eumeta japonica]|uniref:Uncharacterized protein n=1 Tax=Eumeta variegata TaxID=151549 RepID=A0A4C1U9A8_EUMVA|nr:hypothetical protein EVAR_13927_1 [Eumeta japonica]
MPVLYDGVPSSAPVTAGDEKGSNIRSRGVHLGLPTEAVDEYVYVRDRPISYVQLRYDDTKNPARLGSV